MNKDKLSITLLFLWYIGLVALLGGWAIYLIWLAGRYFGALDFDNLEIIGIFWAYIFFWICSFSLILLFFHILFNTKRLRWKMLWTFIIIILNIPSIIYILISQAEIENKAFVKIYNETEYHYLEITLKGVHEEWDIREIKQGDYKIFNYVPPHNNWDGRRYLKSDSLNLIIHNDKIIDTIKFPSLKMGSCNHFTINNNFELIEK